MSSKQQKIKNVGIDMIEIKRMRLNQHFIERFLAESELSEFYLIKTKIAKKRFLAGRWALKEAIYKALPDDHLSFKSIVISKNHFQQPITTIKNYQIHLSLSHNNHSAIAIAIVND